VTVLPETFERYVFEVAVGLADAGFRRIVILNGHGGNTEVLKNVSVRLYREKKVASLVIDWWFLCEPEVRQVYGQTGGHAGIDETAMVQVDHPEQVARKDYNRDMAFLSRPGLHAVPFPGSIILYKEGEGYPDFDPAKAEKLMSAVSSRAAETILDVFRRWKSIK
jgi:creatinine amidohydrolase